MRSLGPPPRPWRAGWRRARRESGSSPVHLSLPSTSTTGRTPLGSECGNSLLAVHQVAGTGPACSLLAFAPEPPRRYRPAVSRSEPRHIRGCMRKRMQSLSRALAASYGSIASARPAEVLTTVMAHLGRAASLLQPGPCYRDCTPLSGRGTFRWAWSRQEEVRPSPASAWRRCASRGTQQPLHHSSSRVPICWRRPHRTGRGMFWRLRRVTLQL